MGCWSEFVFAVPVITIAAMLTSSNLPRPGGPVRPWVYALVYTEFVGMGIGLTLAFVLYARVRWSAVFQPTAPDSVPSGTHRLLHAPLANAAAFMAAAIGALHVAWAFGATVGLPGALIARRSFSSHVINTVDGATMIGAAVVSMMIVHFPGRASGRRWRSRGSAADSCSRGAVGPRQRA